jgi:hypothetical protein
VSEGVQYDAQLVQLLLRFGRGSGYTTASVLEMGCGDGQGNAVHVDSREDGGTRLATGRDRQRQVLDICDRARGEKGVAVVAAVAQTAGGGIETREAATLRDDGGLIGAHAARRIAVDLLQREHVSAQPATCAGQDLRITRSVDVQPVLDVERPESH